MKTLDEVIEIVEERKAHYDEVGCFYCHYSNRADCVDGCVLADVLHYMKEYRDLKSTMDWHAQMEEIRNSIENVPFTWEQLKAMEGKPVWYEHEFWKGWIILGKVEQGVNCEMIPDREERWYIVKDGSAKAYRKERE